MRWASGKHRLTEVYAWFLARWARRLSWKEVAGVFDASWDSVFRAVEMAVEWGRAHQDLSGIQAIGIDEISRQRGHRYLRWSTRSTRTSMRQNRVVSCAWRSTRAGIHPQILLTSQEIRKPLL